MAALVAQASVVGGAAIFAAAIGEMVIAYATVALSCCITIAMALILDSFQVLPDARRLHRDERLLVYALLSLAIICTIGLFAQPLGASRSSMGAIAPTVIALVTAVVATTVSLRTIPPGRQ